MATTRIQHRPVVCQRYQKWPMVVVLVAISMMVLPVVESWSSSSSSSSPSILYGQQQRTRTISELHAYNKNNGHNLPSIDDGNCSNDIIHHYSGGSSVYCGRRRSVLATTAAILVAAQTTTTSVVANAYTPDPDRLQESLYFISRVQEATVQQERFIRKLGGTNDLRTKLKLTLRLVDKNYKLLDQINYSSQFIVVGNALVETSAAGYEAVDALEEAIEFVRTDSNWVDAVSAEAQNERAEVLVAAMQTCRERLLVYTDAMPADKLRNARFRVEDENLRNRDEFDGDDDAGVYNPVNLPWTPVMTDTDKKSAGR